MPADSAIISKQTVGSRLRGLRKGKGFTLKQLSAAAGIPVSTLSKIELGRATIGYDKLMAISQALNIDMSMVLRAESAHVDSGGLAGRVLKAGINEHEEYSSENYQHHFLFSHVDGKAMVPLIVTIYSRSVDEFDAFIKHPGQEFTHVLSGAVQIVFENGTTISLKKNESAYFDSSVGHVYLSTSKAPARVLAVCT